MSSVELALGQGFSETLARLQTRVNRALSHHLSQLNPVEARLQEALHYTLIGKGKRVRPVLVYASAQAVSGLGGELTQDPDAAARDREGAIDAAACALECIHTYSLIHDDLPAMDDDELRRGLPTCHIAFDEATAILAGDALQALAFQLLAEAQDISSQSRIEMIRQLAIAAGSAGMVGGQALDLAAVGQDIPLPALERMHRHKTGALIRASVALGALATEQASPEQLQALDDYAQAIGLAFQVQDDILDVTSDTTTLGKRQGADALLAKPTYVSLLGLDEARAHAQALHQSALAALKDFDGRADTLRRLSAYIVQRIS